MSIRRMMAEGTNRFGLIWVDNGGMKGLAKSSTTT
jgi:hypothetical protein